MDFPGYMTLTLQHFQYFVLVVEQGTMMKAAEILNVSQPLLSQKIAQLEKELGVKLFNRNKGKLQLTDAGNRFLADTRVFLGEIDRAFSSLKDAYGDISEKPIRMGFSDGNESSRINRILKMFKQSYPNTPVHVEIENRLLIAEKLLNGELDICHMVDTEKLHLNKNVSYRKLYNLSINGLISKANPLAARENPEWRDLNGMTCYWPESLNKAMLTKDILRYLRANNIDLTMQFRNVNYYTLRKYLSVDNSMTFTLSKGVDDPTLKVVPLGGITYPFVIAWRKSETKRLEGYMERLVTISKGIMKNTP